MTMRIYPVEHKFGRPKPFAPSFLGIKYKCIDGYIQEVSTRKLSNGKEFRIYTESKNGIKETTLLYLLDNMGNWLKSKLKYFDKNGKIIRILKGERNA